MTVAGTFPLLDTISTPEQLREFSESQLLTLAKELRQYLLQSVDKTGGHLSSGLGTVELTVALHAIFDTPNDKLVWDVGHQSYPHKILTGRREQMHTIRQKGGLSGFPKRSESPFDTFGVGHSSTSISAALGMAIAAQQQGLDQKSVAIIGDGAMTAGMAFEALNHAGDLDANLLVILNDNEMSISPNVGGLSNYFAKVLSGKLYSTVRENSKKVLSNMPPVWELARRAEEHVKGMVIPGTLFEELGFNYIGPVDGHDLPTLLRTLRNMKKMSGPQFLHIVTKKGKGYEPAEEDPISYHAVAPTFYSEPDAKRKATTGLTFTQVFSQWICDQAASDKRLMAITPAMREGSGLVEYSQAFPERYFDVGIAEQHAVTLAAGMACEGLKPVVAIYSTFLQRAYDQLVHDVALQNLPVLFAIDRAGIVGADGATHTGSFDISYLRCIPNMVIAVPSNEQACYQMLSDGFSVDGPVAVRYPRGKGPGVSIDKNAQSRLPVGKGELVFQHKGQSDGVAIMAFGPLLYNAIEAAQSLSEKQPDLSISVADMRYAKPIDAELVMTLANEHSHLITLEDNAIMGGAGSGVNELLMAEGIERDVLNLGLPDVFPEHGTQQELHTDYGLDAAGILNTLQRLLKIDVSNHEAPLSAVPASDKTA